MRSNTVAVGLVIKPGVGRRYQYVYSLYWNHQWWYIQIPWNYHTLGTIPMRVGFGLLQMQICPRRRKTVSDVSCLIEGDATPDLQLYVICHDAQWGIPVFPLLRRTQYHQAMVRWWRWLPALCCGSGCTVLPAWARDCKHSNDSSCPSSLVWSAVASLSRRRSGPDCNTVSPDGRIINTDRYNVAFIDLDQVTLKIHYFNIFPLIW